ncbi:MAG TPA: TraR/DksA C4-type zinc finger protein [Burkholderiales bacterium]|nr:TraR/DksA C4-type zinc finger protein [Burkholderiales bacterium]
MALAEQETRELRSEIERRRAALLSELRADAERLRANPAAVRCVDCQRVHEKTFAGPSASSL